MKRGPTACLAAALHIPGDGSAKSARRSIFSSLYLFFFFSPPSRHLLVGNRGESTIPTFDIARTYPYKADYVYFLAVVAARINPLRRVVSISENAF